MKLRQLGIVALAALVVAASGCSSGQPSATTVNQPDIVVEDTWVRTTDDKPDASMTSLFLTLVNPGTESVQLVSAETDVAGVVELHETVDKDGAKVMQKTDAIDIPAGSHTHLTTGGVHIMLMDLKHELPLGTEVDVTLHFSTNQTLQVVAPAKDLTEEPEHYHPAPSQTVATHTP